VDTGATKEHIDKYSLRGEGEHIRTFEEALATVGKDPDDIDYIIATHLHWDHIANARFCRNAKVFVQEDELNFAYSPHAFFAGLYPKRLYVNLKFNVIRGEREILPGIRVIPAPGHTPGTQAVNIETDQGQAIISGFCSTNANFDIPDEMKAVWPVLVPGIHCDALQAFDSALKIAGMADILIPQHEESFATAQRIPAE
jgi:glyoxylase-like metal-dependent hydrolase (beta-lactamase superfamily II)